METQVAETEETAAPASEEPESTETDTETEVAEAEEGGPKGKPDEAQAEGRIRRENRSLKDELTVERDRARFKDEELARLRQEAGNQKPTEDQDDIVTKGEMDARFKRVEAQQQADAVADERMRWQNCDQIGDERYGKDYFEAVSVVKQRMQQEETVDGFSSTYRYIYNHTDPTEALMFTAKSLTGEKPAAKRKGQTDNERIAENDKEPKTLQGVPASGSKAPGLTYEQLLSLPQTQYNAKRRELSDKEFNKIRDEYRNNKEK